MFIVKSEKKRRVIRLMRVNHWPASPPKFAGVMPVLADSGVHEAVMDLCKKRKLEWIEIVQVCRIGAN